MDGFLFIDKPKGMTSQSVCNRIRKSFNIKKVGHIGTLDPFATGLLIVSLNKATKCEMFLSGDDKEYIATLKLGSKTSTGDIEGEVTESKEVKQYSIEEIKEALNSFLGESYQLPPMTSAIKINGQKLYELAHKGKEIDRPKRLIKVHEISLISYQDDIIVFKAKVSKGTYLRTLGEDIALKLGTVGHLIELRRSKVGPYKIEDSKPLDEISLNDIKSTFDVLKEDALVKEFDEAMIKDIKDGKINYLLEDSKFDKILVINHSHEVIAMYIKEDDKYIFRRGLF